MSLWKNLIDAFSQPSEPPVRPSIGKDAEIYARPSGFVVNTISWSVVDNDGDSSYLESGATDEALGAAIQTALAASLSEELEEGDRIAWNGPEMRTAAAVHERTLGALFGCATQEELYRGLALCLIRLDGGGYHFSPTRNIGLDAWLGIEGGRSDVHLEAESTAEGLGRAARQAISRCMTEAEQQAPDTRVAAARFTPGNVA